MIIDITFKVSYEVFVIVMVKFGSEIVLLSKIVTALLTVLHEILG
jgi:hypothetical protein